jgi:PPOX class probable F420-dependent enzyme
MTVNVSPPPEFREILAAPGVAILTTNGADGYPQTTALWFFFDEEENAVKFSLNTSRQKTKNMMRDPKVSIFFLDPQNPYRTLEIRGAASIASDDDYAFADRIGARYGGADMRQNDRPGESRVVVTVRPEKVNTFGI